MSSYSFDHHHGTRVVVDPSRQVLMAELTEGAGWAEQPKSPERPAGYGPDALVVLQPGYSWAAPLHPSIAKAARNVDRFTPLMALSAKAKHFDDRLYACIDRLAHDGAGAREGLFAVLDRIRAKLPADTKIHALFDAARHLQEGSRPEVGNSKIRTRKWLARFLTDPMKSKPLGFYAGTEDLERIFRHDRLLQTELEPADAALVREVLANDAELHAAYRQHLTLVSSLTGPFAVAPVDDRDPRICAVLPASDSAEGRLVKQLFGDRPIPEGFQLGPELVARIRDGRLQTKPQESDGWYAHQFHAIAALLDPETDGLVIGPRYRKELENTFQALFALNRETHVKQLEVVAAAGAAPLLVAPRISVEPVPEHYGRLAASYRFLRQSLTQMLGETPLRSAEVDGVPAYDGLVDMELLFRGAEAVSRDELGRPREASFETDAARAHFRAWQRHASSDPALETDLRVAVPVWFDIERETVRIFVTLGVQTRTLRFEYLERPAVDVFGRPDTPLFWPSDVQILSPVTIECDVREPPSRAELRALCDQHESADAIRRALEAR